MNIEKFSDTSIRRYCRIKMIGIIIGLIFLMLGIGINIGNVGINISKNTISTPKIFLRGGNDLIYYINHISIMIFLILPMIGIAYLGLRSRKDGMEVYFYLALILVICIIIGVIIEIRG